jgi:hypothetical protein
MRIPVLYGYRLLTGEEFKIKRVFPFCNLQRANNRVSPMEFEPAGGNIEIAQKQF